MQNKTLLLITLILITTLSCQRQEKDFAFLEDEIVRLGYTGKIEKPQGSFQKAALNLVGVDDFLALDGETHKFAIFKLKTDNEKDVLDKIESVLNFVDEYISEEDKKEVARSKEMLKEQSFQHGKILIIWQDEEPVDMVKLIKKSF